MNTTHPEILAAEQNGSRPPKTPVFIGVCEECGEVLTDNFECGSDKHDNLFCGDDCFKKYYGYRSVG